MGAEQLGDLRLVAGKSSLNVALIEALAAGGAAGGALRGAVEEACLVEADIVDEI